MTDEDLSRRLFLQAGGALAGSSLARIGVPGILAISDAACAARDDGAALDVLTPGAATELDAIAARILPTTDTPGAHEAGVVYFMDKALGSFMRDELGSIRAGLAEFQSGLSKPFSELGEEDQDAFLRRRDRSHFFNLVRFMTLVGFFGMSSYGGNRGQIGWKLIGFDGDHGAWLPPFGHYDAEYMRRERDGE